MLFHFIKTATYSVNLSSLYLLTLMVTIPLLVVMCMLELESFPQLFRFKYVFSAFTTA